ncbi:MAG: hypothetical protein ACE5K8_01905, partial [Candidatus Zixiibacteriota bacterium]
MKDSVKSSLFMITLMVTTFFITAVGAAREIPVHLAAEPLVLDKSPMAVSDNVRSYLRQQGGETALIWVFFTDKGVFSKEEFQAKASSVKLSGKVLKRRAKMGLDHIVFADLPVVQNYVDEIVNLGAKHRRTSRWLNAASFEVSLDKLEKIGMLPFVWQIKPVVRYKREEPPVDQLRIDFPQRQSLDGEPDSLNYGYALEQLNQINVPAVHQKGYHGEGVILAIFDTGFRKSHEAFAQHFIEGRVLAEYDFVFNDSNTAN